MTREEHRQAVEEAKREYDQAEPDSDEREKAAEKTLSSIRAWETELEEREKSTNYSSLKWHKVYAEDLKDERQELESIKKQVLSEIASSS